MSLLSLTNPAVGSAYVNVIDLSHQIGDELIHPNPRIIGAFLRHPRVSKMKAIVLRNLKPVLALYARRFAVWPRFRVPAAGWDFGSMKYLTLMISRNISSTNRIDICPPLDRSRHFFVGRRIRRPHPP